MYRVVFVCGSWVEYAMHAAVQTGQTSVSIPYSIPAPPLFMASTPPHPTLPISPGRLSSVAAAHSVMAAQRQSRAGAPSPQFRSPLGDREVGVRVA